MLQLFRGLSILRIKGPLFSCDHHSTPDSIISQLYCPQLEQLDLSSSDLIPTIGDKLLNSKVLTIYRKSVDRCSFYNDEANNTACFPQLKRHNRSLHALEKPHVCHEPEYNKKFSSGDNLNPHVRVHQRNAAATIAALATTEVEILPDSPLSADDTILKGCSETQKNSSSASPGALSPVGPTTNATWARGLWSVFVQHSCSKHTSRGKSASIQCDGSAW